MHTGATTLTFPPSRKKTWWYSLYSQEEEEKNVYCALQGGCRPSGKGSPLPSQLGTTASPKLSSTPTNPIHNHNSHLKWLFTFNPLSLVAFWFSTRGSQATSPKIYELYIHTIHMCIQTTNFILYFGHLLFIDFFCLFPRTVGTSKLEVTWVLLSLRDSIQA